MTNFFEEMKEATGVSLNAVQQRAVMHTDGALLLLASPGSGKTTTLNMKVGYLLLEKKVKAESIMAITFSKASAEDMTERFDKFFSKKTKDKIHFSTIHSFAFEVVRKHFASIGQRYQLIEGNLDEEELKKDFNSMENMPLHKKFILRGLYQQVNGMKPSEEEMSELMTFITFAKNRLLKGAELANIKTNAPKLPEIFEAYETFKKKDENKLLLDFDDMLTHCLQILQENEAIRTKFQQKFEYLLTDESQDNSVVQHELVEILAYPQNNICVVADDDQSIFRWRGSDVNKLLSFSDVYPNATILTMSQNYRSSPEIVDTANTFIKRNKNRYEKEMFTENPSVKPIEVKNFTQFEAQFKYLAEQIKVQDNRKEIAILYRNNSSAVPLANELLRSGIEFYMKDIDTKFFRHWIVEDILNFMRLSYSDKRVDILEKIHTKFSAYITKQQIHALKQFENGESVFDNLLKMDISLYQEKSIPKAKKTFERINQLTPEKAILSIRRELGYDNSIKKMCKSLGFSPENLFGILSNLESIAKGLSTMKEFADRLGELEKIMSESKFNKRKNVVTLSTFHSSKGLEYDSVYMIDLINGIVPTHDDIESYRNKDVEPMEEAVRLFYVGMTRARKQLELLTYNVKDGERVMESVFVKNVKEIIHPTHKAKPMKKKGKEMPIVATEHLYRPHELEVGKEVLHAKFGKGVIVEIAETTLGIQFEKAGFKQFMIAVCLRGGLLQKVNEETLKVYQEIS